MDDNKETLSFGTNRAATHMNSQQLRQHIQDLCEFMSEQTQLPKGELSIQSEDSGKGRDSCL